MKVLVHAAVRYDYELDVPDKFCQDDDDFIDYCLMNDPTDLVDDKTKFHWNGYNNGCLEAIQNLETGKLYYLDEG